MKKIFILTLFAIGLAFAACDPKENLDKNADFESFTFGGIEDNAIIDNAAHTITAKAQETVDLTRIAAEFTLSHGAKATVNDTQQTSKITLNDFTNPVVYKVISGDGKTTKDWVVTITGGIPANAYKIVISNIFDSPLFQAKVKALIAEPYVELASSNIENASATLYVPETVEGKYLVPIGRTFDNWGLEISDPKLQIGPIQFGVSDMSDKFAGELYLGSEDIEAEMIYADRACTIKGTANLDGESMTFDLDLAKGYNWTQIIETDEKATKLIGGTPDDARWYFEPLIGRPSNHVRRLISSNILKRKN